MKKILISSGAKASIRVPKAKIDIPFGVHTVEVTEDQIEALREWIKNPSVKRRMARGEIAVNFEGASEEEAKKSAKALQEKEAKETAFKEEYGYISALAGDELAALYEEVLGKKPGRKGEDTQKKDITEHLRKKAGLE